MDIALSSGQARKPSHHVALMNSVIGRHCLEVWWRTLFRTALFTKQLTTFKQR
jgi:hypothetical protein